MTHRFGSGFRESRPARASTVRGRRKPGDDLRHGRRPDRPGPGL